jgi:acyl-CoA thioester hydrolase
VAGPEPDRYRFATELTVRFAETDAQGVAHNAVYLVWFEIARVDYLARFDGGYPGLRAQGVEATTIESHVSYRTPARFADRLRIHARCDGIRGARFRFEYLIERDDGVAIADGWTAHACVDGKTLRPTRMPSWLVEAIETSESGEPRGSPNHASEG